MGGIWQDLRHGGRMLLRTPGFTLAALLALASGVGATTVIVSYAQATSLRLFAYRAVAALALGALIAAAVPAARAMRIAPVKALRHE